MRNKIASNLFSVLLMSLLIWAPFWSKAAVRCENLFDGKNLNSYGSGSTLPRYGIFKGGEGIDLKLLAAAGFILKGDQVLTQSDQREIGVVRKLQLPYLFQWAESDFKNEVIANRGISEPWMKVMLKADSQAAGKGFYISTDPLDSADYGSALTTFKVKSPVYVLVATAPALHAYLKNSTKTVEALAAAGIDAITYEDYTKTWFSFISNRHLQSPLKGIPLESLKASVRQMNGFHALSTFDNALSIWSLFNNLPSDQREISSKDFQKFLVSDDKIEIAQTLRTIFKSSSKIAKILSLVHVYNTASVKSTGIQFPDEMIRYLQKNLGDDYSIENRTAALIWNELSSAQRKMLPLSGDYLNYAKAYVKLSHHHPITMPELQMLSKRINAESLRRLLSDLWGADNKAIVKVMLSTVQERVLNMTDPMEIKEYTTILSNSDQAEAREILPVPQPRSSAEKTKDSIFDIYDFKTLLKLADENTKNGKSALAGVDFTLAKYQEAKARLDLAKVKTNADFLKAGKELFGLDLQIRDESVVVLDRGVYNMSLGSVQKNDFVKYRALDNYGLSLNISLTHWDASFPAPENRGLLSKNFYQAQKKAQHLKNFKATPQFKQLTQKGLSEILQSILNMDLSKSPDEKFGFSETPTPQSLQALFMTLRPFKEGNELMGSLLFQILSQRAGVSPSSLSYADRNSSLYVQDDFPLYQYMGSLMRAWIRQAKTEDEFVARTRAALGIINAHFEDLRSNPL